MLSVGTGKTSPREHRRKVNEKTTDLIRRLGKDTSKSDLLLGVHRQLQTEVFCFVFPLIVGTNLTEASVIFSHLVCYVAFF